MEVEINPPSYRSLNGKWIHHVRQSDINRFRQCNEMHRAHIFGETTRRTTDVAYVGTCFHAGAQFALDNECGFADATSIAMDMRNKGWDDLFRTEIKELSKAQSLLYGCMETFWNELLDVIL